MTLAWNVSEEGRERNVRRIGRVRKAESLEQILSSTLRAVLSSREVGEDGGGRKRRRPLSAWYSEHAGVKRHDQQAGGEGVNKTD